MVYATLAKASSSSDNIAKYATLPLDAKK